MTMTMALEFGIVRENRGRPLKSRFGKRGLTTLMMNMMVMIMVMIIGKRTLTMTMASSDS